ncbi:MAG: TatD family hydrolase [Treponema sp.]|jgi:TatD DNase family protein|nr:TatD family hydrolase [Treponema sp.]
MASDAHAHPADLARLFPGAEEERRRLGIPCAASAWNRADFEFHEALAYYLQFRSNSLGSKELREIAKGSVGNEVATVNVKLISASLVCCFAVHPQLPAVDPDGARRHLDTLESLARAGRLAAVGETGFDLYNEAYRDTEAVQDELFQAHLETALKYGLPLVLHLRRAMHKVFARSRDLKKVRAVVFHAYPGTPAEGEALLRRGVNAYFSFGTSIILNHRTAMAAAATLPTDRLLTETDAPYQPLRGAAFSRYADLGAVLEGLSALRGGEGGLEAAIDRNWRRVFG